jgi:glycosyltransferase involved in cell wall biosynthesis
MAPCLGTIARRLRKSTKVIGLLDNIIPHERRSGDLALINYFIKSCDAFLSMSHQVANDLLKIKPDAKYEVVPFPVYDNYGEKASKQEGCVKLNLDPNQKYILFFGFVRRYKGLDILLEAMRDDRIRKAGIKLIIAGEFYDEKSSYTIPDDTIVFSDYIPEQDVKYYFAAADVIVQPYRTATQSGISQVAFHFEKPMIVTNVGGLAEIVINNVNGFVVQHVNAKDITEAILNFFQPGVKERFIEGVKQQSKKITWHDHVQALLALS